MLALCLSATMGRLKQRQDARLKGGVTVRVLDQQECRTRAVSPDHGTIWPTVPDDHALEPCRVGRVNCRQICYRRGVRRAFRTHRRDHPFSSRLIRSNPIQQLPLHAGVPRRLRRIRFRLGARQNEHEHERNPSSMHSASLVEAERP
jgi:hypothetical protein